MMQEMTMVIKVGQPFPKKGEITNFTGKTSGVQFKAEIMFIEIVGWSTDGVVGVKLNVTVYVYEVTKPGKPKLKLLENPVSVGG